MVLGLRWYNWLIPTDKTGKSLRIKTDAHGIAILRDFGFYRYIPKGAKEKNYKPEIVEVPFRDAVKRRTQLVDLAARFEKDMGLLRVESQQGKPEIVKRMIGYAKEFLDIHGVKYDEIKSKQGQDALRILQGNSDHDLTEMVRSVEGLIGFETKPRVIFDPYMEVAPQGNGPGFKYRCKHVLRPNDKASPS